MRAKRIPRRFEKRSRRVAYRHQEKMAAGEHLTFVHVTFLVEHSSFRVIFLLLATRRDNTAAAAARADGKTPVVYFAPFKSTRSSATTSLMCR